MLQLPGVVGQILKKIPLFSKLSPSQIQSLIKICKTKQYNAGDVVCAIGERSDSMQILITGELHVIGDDGTVIATLTTLSTVGEMGMILKQPRSAQVKASVESTALQITRPPFERLMSLDAEFKAQFYSNVVESLSRKILDDNLRILDYIDNHTNSIIEIYKLRKQLDFSLSVIEDLTDLSRSDIQDKFKNEGFDEVVILFVDDETNVLSSVKRLLQKQPCNLQFADSGENALEILEQLKVDIVITDIKMAPMDGLTLAKEIELKYPDLPVVALSAVISVAETDSYNFSGYINKPIDVGGFRNLISDILIEDL
jgi:CheY-like chemotaxis protein